MQCNPVPILSTPRTSRGEYVPRENGAVSTKRLESRLNCLMACSYGRKSVNLRIICLWASHTHTHLQKRLQSGYGSWKSEQGNVLISFSYLSVSQIPATMMLIIIALPVGIFLHSYNICKYNLNTQITLGIHFFVEILISFFSSL